VGWRNEINWRESPGRFDTCLAGMYIVPALYRYIYTRYILRAQDGVFGFRIHRNCMTGTENGNRGMDGHLDGNARQV
jgi:hypothetical protein